jgi:hypothetical protein
VSAKSPRRERLALPAFGRELLDLRRRGLVPGRPVVISLDSWHFGRAYPRLVIPGELDPAQIDLSMVAGIDTFVAWSSRISTIARRDALIRALVRCGPCFLWACDIAAPEESFIVISRARGLELPEYS